MHLLQTNGETMSWQTIEAKSPGVTSAGYALYHAWFGAQGVTAPIPWGELVLEDQNRFLEAAVDGLQSVFSGLFDWPGDADENL